MKENGEVLRFFTMHQPKYKQEIVAQIQYLRK
jgi:hypothetical protein